MSHRIYFWCVKNRNGHCYQTRFRAIEQHILKEHPERIESDSVLYRYAPIRRRSSL